MVNKNYQKGRAKEYKICNQLKKDGFIISQRSAGSHSPVDVFAVHKKKKKILFVQAKPNSMSLKKRDALAEELSWLNGRFEVEFKVI